MSARVVRFLVPLCALAAVAGGCRGTERATPAPTAEPSPAPSPTPTPEAEPPAEPEASVIAESTVPRVRVYKRPTAAEPFVTFKHPSEYGIPRVFLVEEERPHWLQVLLPMRPNESTGWIPAEDARLTTTGYRILVDTSANRLTVFDGSEVLTRETVAVGTGGTPTPIGHFYITMLVEPPDPNGPYGPFAYGLSAYSEVLSTFAGGEGQVAIHGTNDPSSIGLAVSHGCIRMDNGAISRLTRILPLGTPVDIRA